MSDNQYGLNPKVIMGLFRGVTELIWRVLGACEEQDRGRLSEGMLKAI